LGSNESYDLRSYLTEDSRWIAFITPVGEPQAYTRVPILTRFGTRNHTRVYLVTFPDDNGPKNLSTNPLDAAIAVPIHESHDPKFEIRKISEVEILPRPPDSVTQKADFNVVVFPTQSCWITSPNDAL